MYTLSSQFSDMLRFCLEQLRLKLSYAKEVVSVGFGLIKVFFSPKFSLSLEKKQHTIVCLFSPQFLYMLRFCLEQLSLRLSYAKKVVSAHFGLIKVFFFSSKEENQPPHCTYVVFLLNFWTCLDFALYYFVSYYTVMGRTFQ